MTSYDATAAPKPTAPSRMDAAITVAQFDQDHADVVLLYRVRTGSFHAKRFIYCGDLGEDRLLGIDAFRTWYANKPVGLKWIKWEQRRRIKFDGASLGLGLKEAMAAFRM